MMRLINLDILTYYDVKIWRKRFRLTRILPQVDKGPDENRIDKCHGRPQPGQEKAMIILWLEKKQKNKKLAISSTIQDLQSKNR